MSQQTATASMRGTVQTPAGVPIPGATVRATHAGTRRSQTVTSNAAGQFEFLQLPPGTYELEASRLGFAAQTQRELILSAGESVNASFVLEPDSSSSAGGQISQDQLVGLPLNGRSYSQLATLQAGVSDPSGGSAARGGGSGNLTVVGGRSDSNNFQLDGTNIMDTSNRVPRSAAGVQLGSDTVLEVQVFSASYSAEYGRGSGGTLNSITRSGTEEFHGSFFEFFRNSKLDARNFLDEGPEPTPFKRNQFGFTITGPLRKGQTYFMTGFEAMRDRLTETEIDFYPTAEAQQGIIKDLEGNILQTVTVDERIKPYLALYPIPQASAAVGEGLARNAAPQFQPTNENFWTIRVDHAISDRDSLFARYSFDNATGVVGQSVFAFTTSTESRQQYFTLVESHIFSTSVVNAFRFGYTRPVSASQTLSSIPIPDEIFFVEGAPQYGQILIPGAASFGPTPSTPNSNVMNSFQFANDLVAQKGSHFLKVGFDIHRYRWDVSSDSYKGAVWSFNSLPSFLQAGPEGTNLTVALAESDGRRAYRQTLAGLYFQDAYSVTSRLQFSLGLRYEPATLIHDKDGKDVFLPDPLRDPAVQIGPILNNNPALRNLSPRLGFTWSPGGGSTVWRGGFGIYYDHLLEYAVDQQKNSVPFYQIAVNLNFDSSKTFPKALNAAAGGQVPLQALVLDYNHFASPRVLRYNLSLQQQLPGGWRVQAAYVGARGNHLFRSYEANQFPAPITREDGTLYFPPNTGRINPAFSSIEITSSDAQSFYNSLQLSLNRNFGGRRSVQASYTYSKSVDDASAPSALPQFGFLRTLDRGLSDFDLRHRLSINYFYTSPFGKGQRWLSSGILGELIGGWSVGGILSYRTGVPFSPTIRVRTRNFLFAASRPNLNPGWSNNPISGVTAGCNYPGTNEVMVEPGRKLGGPDFYFDPCAFSVPKPGTLGNAGRNTLISPSTFSMDVSLQREFLLDSKRRLQFRADIFNLPNHPNFGRLATNVIFSGASGRLAPSVGRPLSTLTTARQIQFALRLSF
ncbi:MAG: TonB-dependent receptor [Acidobacteria bacterium]|nr:TonB-dependent receptor [Acidobacteriota bacterium]